MTSLLDLHRGLIGGLGGHAVEGHGKIVGGMVNTEPTLEGTGHLFETPIQLAADGLHLGKTIESGQGKRIGAGVGEVDATDEGTEGLLGKDDVLGRGGKAEVGIDLLDLELVATDVHDTLGLLGLGLQVGAVEVARGTGSEGLVVGRSLATEGLDEGTETDEGGELVGLVGGIELEHGEVLGLGSEGSDALSAVDVEGPDGLAVQTGDAGKERGEGGLGIVVLEDVAMELVEELHLAIGAHFTGGGTGLRSGMSWLGHADADHTENDHGDGTDGPLFPVGSTAIGI